MWKTGHSLIKEKMKEVGAPIAGELSGHICFGEDYYGFDDALYGACALVQLVGIAVGAAAVGTGGGVPAVRVDAGDPVDVTEETKFDIVIARSRQFQQRYEVIDVDGARVLFDGGWGLLRASNTQPVLVMRFEARTEERLDGDPAIMEQLAARAGRRV
jgi:phosphomannomutase / phosphoglucomutase